MLVHVNANNCNLQGKDSNSSRARSYVATMHTSPSVVVLLLELLALQSWLSRSPGCCQLSCAVGPPIVFLCRPLDSDLGDGQAALACHNGTCLVQLQRLVVV